MDMDEFQKQAKRTRVFEIEGEDAPRYYLVAGLTAQVGEIANRLKKKLRDGEDYVLLKQELAERIGYALWYLAMFADELGLSFNEIAIKNTEFNERRWHQVAEEGSPRSNDFDKGFPEDEQLPKKLIANFETQEISGLKKTIVWVFPGWPDRQGAIQFGDPIDDNSAVEDHYRYHDVMHFAYMAVLWWSPVVRKLLRRKRKSNELVDRVQDGARAVDTEEATTAFIYSYVSQQNFLATSENVDTGVLTTIRTLVRNLEVSACAEMEWERAILISSSALRDLMANQGGWIEVDREARTLRYLGKDDPAAGSR